MTSKKHLLISIVNGNDTGLVHRCVESIVAGTDQISYDLIVIDNCTGYPGLTKLESLGAEVWVNSEPRGFAENHSQVLSRIQDYRYLVIFNDDAFLRNNAFKIMIDEMDQDEAIAISSCHIEDPDGELQPNASSFLTIRYFIKSMLGLDRQPGQRYSDFLLEYIDYGKTQSVDWVTGCCMMIRTDYIRQHGFLDTNYFMFLEDTDICLKAKRSGYKIKYIAEAKIVHHGAASSKDDSGRFKAHVVVARHRSRLYYLAKISYLQYALYALFINGYLIAKMTRDLLRGDTKRNGELLRCMRYRPLY